MTTQTIDCVMPDIYLIAWWLNEIAQPIAIIGAVAIWVGKNLKRR